MFKDAECGRKKNRQHRNDRNTGPKKELRLVAEIGEERVRRRGGHSGSNRIRIEYVYFVSRSKRKRQEIGDDCHKPEDSLAHGHVRFRIMLVSMSRMVPPTFLPGFKIFNGSNIFLTSANKVHMFSPYIIER